MFHVKQTLRKIILQAFCLQKACMMVMLIYKCKELYDHRTFHVQQFFNNLLCKYFADKMFVR